MCERSGPLGMGSSRTSWTARTLLVIGTLLLHASAAGAQARSAEPAADRSSAVELAAGACRLERWAAAVDLMRVVERNARRAEDWLCLARAQRHTGQWVAALDSYDELAESEAPTLQDTPAKSRSGKLGLNKAARNRAARNENAAALSKAAAASDQLAKYTEARQLGAVERQELEDQLGWLQIVPSAPLPASVKLSLDGEAISRSRIGVAFPVQPGRHAFAVEVRGVVRELDHWRVAQGERRTVKLSLPAEPRARQAVAPPRAVQRQLHPHLERQAPPRSELARWARGALYTGGISGATGFVLLASSGIGGRSHDGLFYSGMGSFLLGGVGLLTGAGLYLADEVGGSRPSETPPASSRRPPLQPWVSTNGAGVSGSF
jgi:hypothetical protein